MVDLAQDLAGGATPAASALGIWFPDAAPLAPSALDDEFAVDGAYDAKWSAFDPGAGLVATYPLVANGGLVIETTTHGAGAGARKCCGLYQPVAAAEYAIYTKVSVISLTGAFNLLAGIGLGQAMAAAPTTSDLYTFGITTRAIASQNVFESLTWTDYANPTSVNNTIANVTGGYLRLRVNGTTVSADFSTDAVGWFQVDTRVLGYTPAQVFLWSDNGNTGVNGFASFEFFRYFAGAGLSNRLVNSIGRRL